VLDMTQTVMAEGVKKRFGSVEALRGIDLVVEPGQVVAVLGPNGAGKTTFLRAVATLLVPDEGTLQVAGMDIVRDASGVRRVIGLAGQAAAVEDALTGRENLEMVAQLYGHDRRRATATAAAVLDQLGLTDVADRQARTYSGGMRRRLDLGASLVGRPRLLLLDEPTTGVDPRSRIELWDAVRALVRNGTDVLLTTQYLDEADRLADRIVIIDRGRVIAQGTPAELKAKVGRDVIEIHAREPRTVAQALTAVAGEAPDVDVEAQRIALSVTNGTSTLVTVLRKLDELGIDVTDVALRRPTLDEVFLALTGQQEGRAVDDDAPPNRRPDRMPAA
jgi:ABC-2 type transport system ATP-binding protein